MPKLDPFVGLFAAFVGAMAAVPVPVFLFLRADIARVDTGLRAEIAGVRDGLALADEQLARIEAALFGYGRPMDGLEAGQAALRGEPVAADERMVRVEGADAIGRPFPERVAQAPGPEPGADGWQAWECVANGCGLDGFRRAGRADRVAARRREPAHGPSRGRRVFPLTKRGRRPGCARAPRNRVADASGADPPKGESPYPRLHPYL